jgi:hypothetical protein
MATTHTAMLANVKYMTGNKAGIDSTITNNINHAIRQMVMQVRPQEAWATTTFNTADNDSSYDIGSGGQINITDFLAVLMVRNDTSDVELKRGGMRGYNRNLQDTAVDATTGRPNRWTRLANNLIIYSKIPDGVYSLKLTYLKRPTAISGSTAFPLNDEWIRPCELLAAAITFTDLADQANANLKFKAYDKAIQAFDKPENIEEEAPEASIRIVHNLNYGDY